MALGGASGHYLTRHDNDLMGGFVRRNGLTLGMLLILKDFLLVA
jgi:hypothetical protein